MSDETTRLRALLERATPGPWVSMEGSGLRKTDAALIVAAVNALPGLLDRVESAERERDSLRAQLDTMAEAYRALLMGQPEPVRPAPVLSERARAALDRVWPRRDDVAARAERERDDLAATLETRTAEHALAMERVAELEAIIAGRTTPPTDAEIEAHAAAGGGWLVKWVVGTTTQRAVGDEFGAVHPPSDVRTWRDRNEVVRWIALDADGCPCAWPTAEVSRG